MSNRVTSTKQSSGSSDSVTIININASVNNKSHPVIESFTPGTYQVRFIGKAEGGMYDAWSRWNFVSGCDQDGANCTTGWLNEYCLTSNEFSVTVPSSGIFSTPDLALLNAENTSFTLLSNRNVNFFIDDELLSDNSGGVSLALKKILAPDSHPFLVNFALLLLFIGSGIGT